MVQPADTLVKYVRVVDAAGAGVTGLTLAGDFAFTAYERAYGGSAASYSASPTLTELGSGDYVLAWSAPSTAGFWAAKLVPNSSSHYLFESFWQGEMEAQDLDSTYGAAATPSVTLTGEGTIGQQVAMQLVAFRWAERTWTFVDDNGGAVDIAANYANLALSINSEDHTTTSWDGTNGSPVGFSLTASANVIIAHFPEDAAFFSAEPDGVLQPQRLYYEITGDKSSDAAKTVSLVRSSPLDIIRREVGK